MHWALVGDESMTYEAIQVLRTLSNKPTSQNARPDDVPRTLEDQAADFKALS